MQKKVQKSFQKCLYDSHLGDQVDKLVARLLATPRFESRHLLKIQNGRHKQRSGQHTLARQKNKKNK